MNILIATPLAPSDVGGPAQYAHRLQKALEAKGQTVFALTFQSVSRFPSGLRHIVLFFIALRGVWKSDAVIILDTFSMALPVSIASRLLRKKSVIRAGGDFVWEHYVGRTKESIPLSSFYTSAVVLSFKERLIMWLQRNIIFPNSSVLVLSTEWLFDIWKTPYQLSESSIHFIYNAVPFEENKNERSDTQRKLVVWIGRDIPLKNVRALDEAVARVRTIYPQLQYEKYSSLSHHEVIQVLRQSRVLVVPSLSEVSPNLALEALSCGTPVLLTKDCGFREILDGVAIWIDPLSVDDITEKLSYLMSAEGYEDARKRIKDFSYAKTYDEIASEFLMLLKV